MIFMMSVNFNIFIFELKESGPVLCPFMLFFFFNACKLICHNKAHATVIMKFIRRK